MARHQDSSLTNKFHSSYIPEPMSGCWLWIGSIRGSSTKKAANELKYGCMWANGRAIVAHRFSYSIHLSDPNPKNHIHHKCENTLCVNPSHLQEVTPAEHVLLTKGCAGYMAAHATHCSQGHELPLSKGNRRNRGCLICKIERAKNYKKTKCFDRFTQARTTRSGQAEKTHCPKGHEYNEKNTGWTHKPYGSSRYCRQCNADKVNARYRAKSKPLCSSKIPDGSTCKNGHAHTPETCYFGGRGGIVCRICREATTRKTAIRKKQKIQV